MRTSSLLFPVSLLAWASAAPTVYLAGDSTMASLGGGSGTEGWGQYLKYSLSVPVVNKAIGGRSARSFTREGRFDDIADLLVEDDWVVIEFGHNDGSSSPDNGRSDCSGTGDEVCTVTYNGATETTHTFPKYLEWAAGNFTAKGANVIISSQTPNNPDETGVFVQGTPPRFVGYAATAATVAGVDYVDHNAYSYAAYKPLTVAVVNAYFPNDHTHTSANGADLVHKAFVKGLLCGSSGLKSYVVNATSAVSGSCL